jgi:hypothetical protein
MRYLALFCTLPPVEQTDCYPSRSHSVLDFITRKASRLVLPYNPGGMQFKQGYDMESWLLKSLI